MSRQDKGASVPDQALAVPVEPASGLGHSGFDPSRAWAVIDDWSFPVAQVYSETAKTIEAKVGFGRRWSRLAKSKVLAFMPSQADAAKLSERLKSADAEKRRRENAARTWFANEKAKLCASAIEARRAETRSGSVHESAAAKPDAQTEGSNV